MPDKHPESLFMVMDGRARYDMDRAVCLSVDDSLQEAKNRLGMSIPFKGVK